MIALLKKDWRINRAPVVGALVVMLVIYGMTLFYALIYPNKYTQNIDFAARFVDSGTIMLMISCVLAACFGGMSFAAERRDRCADFLAMLPVSRLRIVLSKSIVGWVCALAPWLLNAMLIQAIYSTHQDQFNDRSFIQFLAYTGCCLIMCFGLAWLLSTFLESPSISSSISFGATIAIIFLVVNTGNNDYYSQRRVYALLTWITACVGIVSYIAGTIYYLKRVEP